MQKGKENDIVDQNECKENKVTRSSMRNNCLTFFK